MAESGNSGASEEAGSAIVAPAREPYRYNSMTLAARIFAWSVAGITFAFILNVYLNFWQGWPGAGAAFSGGGGLSWVQLLIYAAAIAGPA